MNQLFQNEDAHNLKIQDYGCYYIFLLNCYQDITKHQLLPELINAVYVQSNRTYTFNNDGNKKYYMTKNCFVNNISGIIQLVSGFTGIDVHMRQVSKDEEFNYRAGLFDRTTTRGKYVAHFVRVGLDTDDVIEDSWKGGSKTVRIGILRSYRCIKARLL